MLSQLTIRNYALVNTLEIDLHQGMSALTGETGAGKSIILGALGLALGDRADKGVIRAGCRQAEICAEFDLTDNVEAHSWLQQHDLLPQHDVATTTCLLRRTVNAEGRSRAYINGTPVTLADLGKLGDMLLDIHSQHEHHSLLKKSTHLRLLDEFGGYGELLQKLTGTWRRWHDNQLLIQQTRDESEHMTAQMQLVSYQVNELDELAPQADEAASLEQEFQQLNTADSTLGTLQQVLALCAQDEGFAINSALNEARALLQSLPFRDPSLVEIQDLLGNASIQIEEAIAELQRALGSLESNPQRLEQVNQRLADLHRVARKHKVEPDALFALHQDLQQQLRRYQQTDQELDHLQQLDSQYRDTYAELAKQLGKKRTAAAGKLAKLINQQLGELGMADAQLQVHLEPLAPGANPAPLGQETAEFLVSTNPGQPASPLIKIASGGELSRISLAIQVITARTSRTPSLVFDEVDVGIGGGIARTVGRLLRELGQHTQILCVTHQAQVASQAHHHYLVSKASDGASTSSQINELDAQQVVQEIARMLGGEEFSDESLAHAEQMVANS